MTAAAAGLLVCPDCPDGWPTIPALRDHWQQSGHGPARLLTETLPKPKPKPALRPTPVRRRSQRGAEPPPGGSELLVRGERLLRASGLLTDSPRWPHPDAMPRRWHRCSWCSNQYPTAGILAVHLDRRSGAAGHPIQRPPASPPIQPPPASLPPSGWVDDLDDCRYCSRRTRYMASHLSLYAGAEGHPPRQPSAGGRDNALPRAEFARISSPS